MNTLASVAAARAIWFPSFRIFGDMPLVSANTEVGEGAVVRVAVFRLAMLDPQSRKRACNKCIVECSLLSDCDELQALENVGGIRKIFALTAPIVTILSVIEGIRR